MTSMSIEEAKELLSYHSFRNENIEEPREINGFLGSLRPFKGELNEKNFIEVMECMKVLQDEFSQKQVDITQPTLSHHMKILCECGLVNARKGGKWQHYSLNMEVWKQFVYFIGSMVEGEQG